DRTRTRPRTAERNVVRALRPVEVLRKLRRVDVEGTGEAGVEDPPLKHVLTGNRSIRVHEGLHSEHTECRYAGALLANGVGVLVSKTGIRNEMWIDHVIHPRRDGVLQRAIAASRTGGIEQIRMVLVE